MPWKMKTASSFAAPFERQEVSSEETKVGEVMSPWSGTMRLLVGEEALMRSRSGPEGMMGGERSVR